MFDVLTQGLEHSYTLPSSDYVVRNRNDFGLVCRSKSERFRTRLGQSHNQVYTYDVVHLILPGIFDGTGIIFRIEDLFDNTAYLKAMKEKLYQQINNFSTSSNAFQLRFTDVAVNDNEPKSLELIGDIVQFVTWYVLPSQSRSIARYINDAIGHLKAYLHIDHNATADQLEGFVARMLVDNKADGFQRQAITAWMSNKYATLVENAKPTVYLTKAQVQLKQEKEAGTGASARAAVTVVAFEPLDPAVKQRVLGTFQRFVDLVWNFIRERRLTESKRARIVVEIGLLEPSTVLGRYDGRGTIVVNEYPLSKLDLLSFFKLSPYDPIKLKLDEVYHRYLQFSLLRDSVLIHEIEHARRDTVHEATGGSHGDIVNPFGEVRIGTEYLLSRFGESENRTDICIGQSAFLRYRSTQ
ncbi:MAG: hypothetical protein ACYCOU_04530 [Sulfobacillus sp.]